MKVDFLRSIAATQMMTLLELHFADLVSGLSVHRLGSACAHKGESESEFKDLTKWAQPNLARKR